MTLPHDGKPAGSALGGRGSFSDRDLGIGMQGLHASDGFVVALKAHT